MPNNFEIYASMYKLWPGQRMHNARTLNVRTYTELKLKQLCLFHRKQIQQKCSGIKRANEDSKNPSFDQSLILSIHTCTGLNKIFSSRFVQCYKPYAVLLP